MEVDALRRSLVANPDQRCPGTENTGLHLEHAQQIDLADLVAHPGASTSSGF